MTFYADLKTTATRLLTDKGQQVTVTRSVTSSFNPATGIETPGSDVTFTGYGAAFNYSDNKIDGTLVRSGDIRFLFEATNTSPLINDTTVIDSEAYTVIRVSPTSPAGTAVVYTLQLRK